MKKYYLLFILLCSLFTFGQVGIATTNPQESLHIGGNTSTIRVEGLDEVNDLLNLGPTKLTPVFVDNQGNFTLVKPGYTSGDTGYVLPLNFLKYDTNFVPNNPLGLPAPFDKYGVVINSDLTNESETAVIEKVTITVPTNSMIEVKYALSLYFSSTDLSTPPYSSVIMDKNTRVIQTYFCIDINSDGLSAAEESLKYGVKGQYYASDKGGTKGYPYMNSQGYADLPTGNHTIYFYGVVNDGPNIYTSIGFGGANEYLKIRLFN
jgi:hypothetical protein